MRSEGVTILADNVLSFAVLVANSIFDLDSQVSH